MASPYQCPYVRYACPCSDTASTPPSAINGKRTSQQDATTNNDDDDDSLNPQHLTVYPLEQLLFCDECNHTRCEKCWQDETIYWYCPSCQFDVPSSSVKQDQNRCVRSCSNCPLCQANLSTVQLPRSQTSSTHLRPDAASSSSSSSSDVTYILHCLYCDWSSLDIDLTFPKSGRINELVYKAWKQRHGSQQEEKEDGELKLIDGVPHHDTTFASLSRFYRDQLSESSDQPNMYSSSPYSSPANLARIMNLYGGLSVNALKKTREKPQPMREARGLQEGLVTYNADGIPGEEELLHKMRTLGLQETASSQQRLTTPLNYDARFQSNLWPIATPLKVRRGKRCRSCRHILTKPDHKVGSMRYKIRLLALNHVPRLSIAPLSQQQQQTTRPLHPSFPLRPEPVPEIHLPPHQAQQYILTVRNPLFETVKITLATPTTTPGKIPSKVTILCPSFTVGAAGDMWDEALSSAQPTSTTAGDGSRRAAMASLTGSTSDRSAQQAPEAGKVWQKSRNSTSVVVEVVPGAVVDEARESPDDDVLEIPVYVRAEWEAVPPGEDEQKGAKESREFAFWCVLGVGRVVA